MPSMGYSRPTLRNFVVSILKGIKPIKQKFVNVFMLCHKIKFKKLFKKIVMGSKGLVEQWKIHRLPYVLQFPNFLSQKQTCYQSLLYLKNKNKKRFFKNWSKLTDTKRLLKMIKRKVHKFLHSERKTQWEKYKHYVINTTQVEDTKSIHLENLEALS